MDFNRFKINAISTSLIALSLIGCTLSQRHPDSGYHSLSGMNDGLGEPGWARATGLNTESESPQNTDIRYKVRVPTSIPNIPASAVQELITEGDLALGMTRDAVRESWGSPARVEVSGNPKMGNERWLYKEFLPSREGYIPQQRFVFFKSGKVAGWKTSAIGIE